MLLLLVTVFFAIGYLVSLRRVLRRADTDYRKAVERRLEAIRAA
jgi:hypothetical protein